MSIRHTAKAVVPALVHIDPSSSGHLGLAALVGDEVSVAHVSALKHAIGRTWQERVVPFVSSARSSAARVGLDLVVACEVPPPTMHAKSGRQGSQGVIGLGLGRVLGAAELWCAQERILYAETTVSTWHAYRDQLCELYSVPMPEAARAQNPFASGECRLAPRLDAPVVGGKVEVRWKCGTTRHVLLRHRETMSTACPECSKPKTDSERQAAVTDRHKATSYALASALWPNVVADVVSGARASATGEDADTRAPWRLSGVADACEALLQALTVRDKGLGATKARG